MFLENLRIFISENNTLFDLDTLEIFNLDEKHKLSFIEANHKFSNDQEITNYLKNREIITEIARLKSVKLNVSHSCNLKCPYCYASQGTFGNNHLMSMETAQKIGDVIEKELPNLENIIFFGGEPTLNPDIIEYFCHRFESKNFLMQTNGVLLNEERLINLIKNFDIKLTLSIDGFKKYHDLNRITHDNKPTYDLIKKNVLFLNTLDIWIQTIEATLPESVISKYGRQKIVDNLYKDFKCYNIIIHNIMDLNLAERKNNIKDNTSLFDKEIFDQLISDKPYLISDENLLAISPFLSYDTISEYFCSAGREIISIDPQGDIWPCHLMVLSDYKLSNVYSFDKKTFTDEVKRLHEHNKLNNKCSSCIAHYYCHRCLKVFSDDHNQCTKKIENTKRALEFLSQNLERLDIITARLFPITQKEKVV